MEVTLNGVNGLTYPVLSTWNWEVALYLFLGGLVAGQMVLASFLHLARARAFGRAVAAADLTSLPLLGAGMLFLWLDLANRWNVWRFYTTVQWTSVMSWGSWILLLAMGLLALRMLSRVPDWRGRRPLKRLWALGDRLARTVLRFDRPLAALTLLVGLAVGLYTGLLLSTIAARPLWNSAVLPFLFLTSGVGSGTAFMMLFLRADEQARLLPFSIIVAVLELALIAGYMASLALGTRAMQRASALLFAGNYALLFWGMVVVLGLLVPIVLEALEWRRRHVPGVTPQTSPALALAGGAALRFVVVSAGLLSFI